MGVKEPRVRFQMLDKQWGTITPSGWLALDPSLLSMPKELGEYVIVHELVHLLAPNHGRLFKLFLYAYLLARFPSPPPSATSKGRTEGQKRWGRQSFSPRAIQDGRYVRR